MAHLKSETGNDAISFGGMVVYLVLGLTFGLVALDIIGISVPENHPQSLRIFENLCLGAIGCLILHALLAGVVVVARSLLMMAVSALGLAVDAGERFGVIAAELMKAFVAATGRLALRAITYPFRTIHAHTIAPFLERRRQMAELRALYAEVMDEYPDFDAFVRAFNNGTGPESEGEKVEESSVPPHDAYADALAILDLPSDGAFTNAEFKAAYRKRMKEVHPDITGDQTLATQLNEARDIVLARKGWKK